MRRYLRLRRSSDIGSLVFIVGFLFLLWIINGINLSVQDYRLFRLFFDPLLGFWLFVLMLGLNLLLLLIGRKKYWPEGVKGKAIAFLYGCISISMILLTVISTFFFALPAYITNVQRLPIETNGVVEYLGSSSSRGVTSYYMKMDDIRYYISRSWYYELDAGQELPFLAIGNRAFPEGYVDFTFVGIVVGVAVLIGWFFTLYFIVFGLIAIFDKSNSFGPLEQLDGIL